MRVSMLAVREAIKEAGGYRVLRSCVEGRENAGGGEHGRGLVSRQVNPSQFSSASGSQAT